MLNKIRNAIAVKLNEVFGDAYLVHTEEIKQGLKEPCFFILFLNPSREKKLGARYLMRYPIDVHYFPVGANKNEDINNIADQLYDALEYITVDEALIRGDKMRFEISGGVLHFFVEYSMYLVKAEAPEVFMNEIEIGGVLK